MGARLFKKGNRVSKAFPYAVSVSSKMTHQYIDVPGGDHGNVIGSGMPDIFKFFAQHSKPASR